MAICPVSVEPSISSDVVWNFASTQRARSRPAAPFRTAEFHRRQLDLRRGEVRVDRSRCRCPRPRRSARAAAISAG